ncbi:MAG: 4-hydroxythreonine-4-phosphate dehydrogenase PdxA [Oscillospiraceae bacterium]
MEKIIIAVTIGDAGGIGPEISIKAVLNNDVKNECNCFIIGSAAIIKMAAKKLNINKKVCVCKEFAQIDFENDYINVLEIGILDESSFAIGKATKETGKASVLCMDIAVKLCNEKKIAAFASAPLSKQGMALAGYHFAGATEYLAHITNAKEYAMVLFFGSIKMFYVTNHVGLKEAILNLNEQDILKKICFIDKVLDEIGETDKRIAVAALNPHASENGKMGDEEKLIIEPAINKARENGIDAVGPIPADALFIKARDGIYHTVLAMFHDQGNIAAKLLNFGSGVTLISGLSVIRTSVAHGTAYDIAGKGIASEDTLVSAIHTAVDVAKRKGK